MNKKKEAIILLGAPGSGKGTQGEILEKKTKYKRYVMSDLIKVELKKGQKKWAKEYDITSGLLLNDLDIFELFREGFKLEDKVILDGIPRTLDQAYWLYGYLTEHKYKMKVVLLDCNEQRLLKRIIKRGEEQGRGDDTPEVFKERLEIYDKIKETVMEVYSEEILWVDGDQAIEDVTKSMFVILGVK